MLRFFVGFLAFLPFLNGYAPFFMPLYGRFFLDFEYLQPFKLGGNAPFSASPSLADKLARNTATFTIDEIADEI